MSLLLAKAALRDNWHLAALLMVVLASATYLQYSKDSRPAEAEEAEFANADKSGAVQEPMQERPSPQEQAKTVIASHKAHFEENPTDKDAPAYLNAMGNLYRQKLRDYKSAIQCYELILHDYPDWDGLRNALLPLADCYRRLDDAEGARRVYQEMMRRYPPESPEYQFAKAEIGR